MRYPACSEHLAERPAGNAPAFEGSLKALVVRLVASFLDTAAGRIIEPWRPARMLRDGASVGPKACRLSRRRRNGRIARRMSDDPTGPLHRN